MTRDRARALAMAGAAIFIGGLLQAPAANAQSRPTYDEATVLRGLQIAPVPLNTQGRDRNQVGYGSYLVNAAGGCNDCHTNPNWKPDGDPYKGMPKQINTAGYLAGGIAFGPFTSRNITPSADGPTTGNLANFKEVFRRGTDLRKLHPEMGPLLQVMPWPVYGELTDPDLEAIFAYLSSIPCLEGGPGERANRCTQRSAATAAVVEQKDITTVAPQIVLDGSKSTSADGKPLSYRWTVAPGSPTAAIIRADSAMPTVQFSVGPAVHRFQLTVTDSAGRTATETVSVNFARSL